MKAIKEYLAGSHHRRGHNKNKQELKKSDVSAQKKSVMKIKTQKQATM